MAGVGFELRRMIDERRGMMAKVRAYSCAGLISSGPWLMTILTLTLLNLAGPYLGGTEGYSLFRALVTYAFAFSLILQGIAQMAVTRRVADLLYTKRYDAVLPAFVATIVAVGVVHALIGVAFCAWAGFPVLLSVVSVTLFAIIGMTWIALIWLTVVRQYDEVLRAYVYGTLVAMIGVVLLFLARGTVGILAAYTAGQAFTLALLLRTIARGMNASGGRDLSVLKSLVSFPVLVGVGLFYNAAIWVDKMIFWFQDGIGPHSLVRYHPLYDTCSFLAYLTVVPALAVNLVRLETAFYERYRGYYGAILGGTPLAVIEDKRRRMLRNLEESMVRLIKTQGAISAVVILFAPVICETLKLPPISVRLFRLTCLGAFFHVLLLINILMQMYFDLRKQALATSFVFFALNGLLAWWSVNRGVETYGIGYALASFLSLLLGYLLLYRSLDQLDYMTFTSQPIGSDEERREATVLAEQERAAEEAAAAVESVEEEEEEVRKAPAPIVVAAGEMAPPDAEDEIAVDAIVLELEEQEAVPDDSSRRPVPPTCPAEGPPERGRKLRRSEGGGPEGAEADDAPRQAAAAAADGWEVPAGAGLETATDLPEPRPAGPPREVEPAPDTPVETATDVPRPAKLVPAAEQATDAPVETATDLPGAPKLTPPAPVASDATATDLPGEPKLTPPAPVAVEPDATATDLPDESRLAPSTTEVPEAATTEPAVATPEETATDLPREPRIAVPEATEQDATATEAASSVFGETTAADRTDEHETATEEPPETATDLAGEPGVTRPAAAESESTATDVDPTAFDAAADDVADELEFVGFLRPPPAEESGPAETDHWSLVDALEAASREEDAEATATDVGELSALEAAVDDLAAQVEADVAHEEPEEDATATDVGELSALEAAVEELAAQVEADPLQEEPEAEATATDVAGLAALKDAVKDLAGEVDAGALDEEAPEEDDEEEEPEETTHSQLDIIRRHFGKRSTVDPSDETEAE